jgi:hypothetical protein
MAISRVGTSSQRSTAQEKPVNPNQPRKRNPRLSQSVHVSPGDKMTSYLDKKGIILASNKPPPAYAHLYPRVKPSLDLSVKDVHL